MSCFEVATCRSDRFHQLEYLSAAPAICGLTDWLGLAGTIPRLASTTTRTSDSR